ncbi:deoxynucleoside kinase [Candidatus Dependentiae bacterium]|nr:deoxynucleoside kinase [Candidatus Dependentiae bacterium]
MHALHNQKYFAVEGNIGAGKSTFLTIIRTFLNARVVMEPHEKWQNVGGHNLLDKFYADSSRWAYTFQMYAFITRMMEKREASVSSSEVVHILERSVFSDRYCFAQNCFELGVMTELEWNLYRECFDWLAESHAATPHGFIYMQTDPEICYKRLLKRNRSEEAGVSLDYLRTVHEKHESWLIKKEGIASSLVDVPVLVIPCHEDFENDRELQKAHMAKIIDFLEVYHEIPEQVTARPEMSY